MKKIPLSLIIATILFAACDYEAKPNPIHMYYEEIPVVVTRCEYIQWYAGTVHYQADISVYSEEYDLKRIYRLNGWEARDYKEVRKGDVITATLYSWKNIDTGEITNRELGHIEYKEYEEDDSDEVD